MFSRLGSLTGAFSFLINMKTLIFILLCNISYCQVMKLDMKVSRVNLTKETPPNTLTEKVTLILQHNNIGLITSKDTLELIQVQIKEYKLYRDIRNSNQLYSVYIVSAKDGLLIMINPLRPFKNEVYSIILKL